MFSVLLLYTYTHSYFLSPFFLSPFHCGRIKCIPLLFFFTSFSPSFLLSSPLLLHSSRVCVFRFTLFLFRSLFTGGIVLLCVASPRTERPSSFTASSILFVFLLALLFLFFSLSLSLSLPSVCVLLLSLLLSTLVSHVEF